MSDPTVTGVGGILEAYHGMLQNSRLLGPTNFSPVIRRTIDVVRQYPQPHRAYGVLLIITDGAITDIDETVACAPALAPGCCSKAALLPAAVIKHAA